MSSEEKSDKELFHYQKMLDIQVDGKTVHITNLTE